MKGIDVIKKLSNMLPQHSLITIYKAFVKPHFNYGDILYDQPNNESLCKKYSIQCCSCHYRCHYTSQMKLYNELGFVSLKFSWRLLRKLCLFYKINKTGLPEYLLNIIPQSNHQCNTQPTEDVTTFYCRTDIFKYSCFPSTILGWNNIDLKTRKINSLMSFKNSLLGVGWPTAMPMYGIQNPIGLKFLTRLQLGLSHLNEHKFKHNFKDCVNPLFSCSLEIESPSHFFLHCHYFTNTFNPLRWFEINWCKYSKFSRQWNSRINSLWWSENWP